MKKRIEMIPTSALRRTQAELKKPEPATHLTGMETEYGQFKNQDAFELLWNRVNGGQHEAC